MSPSRFTVLAGAALLLFAASCGNSPERLPVSPSPAPIPSSVTGTWSGSYTAVCPASPTCGSVSGTPMGPQPFALVLRQDGDVITGQINLTGWIDRVAAVSGSIAADGAMTLQGGSSWPAAGFCVPAGGWRLESWNARFDTRTHTIAGAFAFVTQKHLSSCYYQQELPVNAMSMTLSPGVIPKAPFAGHWQGTYLVMTCTPVGWNTCIPSPSGEVAINLQLSQDGDTVTGAATGISFSNSTPLPVAATGVVDSTLNLTGSRTEIVGGGTHTIRITRWSTARDAVGLLQGNFTFVDEVFWTSGPNQGTTWSTTYDAELRNLVKVPW